MDAGGQHIDECRWIGASVSKLKTRAGGEDWTAVARTNGDREDVCADGGQVRQLPRVLVESRGMDTGDGDNGCRWHGQWRQESFQKSYVSRKILCVRIYLYYNLESKELKPFLPRLISLYLSRRPHLSGLQP